MATPAWMLNPKYSELPNVTDVDQLLAHLSTGGTIKAAGVGWTESPANTFQTPNDPAGRWFKMAFTRNSALQLDMTLTDDQGRAAAARRIDATSGSTWRFYYTSRYLYMEEVGQTMYFAATLLSLPPESELAHNRYVLTQGRNTTAGANTGDTDLWQQIGAAGSYVNQSTSGMQGRTRGGNYMDLDVHVSGHLRARSYRVIGQETGGQVIRGRAYNLLMVNKDLVAPGDERVFPVGGGASGTWKTLVIPEASTPRYRLMMRKS